MLKVMRVIFVILYLFIASAHAGQNACFHDAAKRIGVDPDLLMAIAMVESRMNPYELQQNKDGTVDIGTMQINSQHLPLLKRAGFSAKDLFDPCININVGALILQDCLRTHGSTWRAVGAYNARTDRRRREYVGRVSKVYFKLKSKNGG